MPAPAAVKAAVHSPAPAMSTRSRRSKMGKDSLTSVAHVIARSAAGTAAPTAARPAAQE